MSKACLSENCSGNFPIKNCVDDKIISYREPVKGELERIYKEDNCIFIVTNSTNELKYTDAYLFDIIGI